MSSYRKRGRASVKEVAHPQTAKEKLTDDNIDTESLPPSVDDLRKGVVDLLSELPSQWTKAALAYGVTLNLDAVLCASGKHIATSIRTVTEAAEASRQKLQSIQRMHHTSSGYRIDELLAALSAAESVKIAALECELEKLDGVLERTRREHKAARTAVATLDDAAFTAAHIDITTNLEALNLMVATLSVGPVEPTVLRVDISIDALTSDISTIGTVIAPRGVLARHVEVRGLPKHARPGRLLQFDLALSADYPCTAPAELEAAAASLVPHVHVDVSLVCGEVSPPLLATLASAAGGRSVSVSVLVPLNAGTDSKVVIRGISFACQPVTHGQSLPARVAVVTGMLAPLRLEEAAEDMMSTPVISCSGMLYAPRYGSPDVLVFSADGTPLTCLSLASLGLSINTSTVALHEESSTLLLADISGKASKLVAVDAVSRAVRWSAGLSGGSYGIAVLPAQGLVATCSYHENELRFHRLADGVLVASSYEHQPSIAATDNVTSTLYVSVGRTVASYRWNLDGGALVPEGVVEAAGKTKNMRPLAVVAPAPGLLSSYLVVGTFDTPTLLVLSLPDRRLIHTHTITGINVMGLAADPSGTALAVCDRASKTIHVLPWPLPGMPPLQ
jgi:hypothetical protein